MAEVIDRPDRGRLEEVVDGQVAELFYRITDGLMVLIHTEVPEALGGQGVGGHLVRAAVNRAARDGLTVVPLCPFARHWLERHSDDAAGAPIDWQLGQ